MNKIVVAVIILIVVVGGYFLVKGEKSYFRFWTSEPTASPQGEEVQDEEGIKVINVSGNEFAFNPSTITVDEGEAVKIVFKNDGKFPHNWVVEGLGIMTKTINPGQTDAVEFTAPSAGTYVTFCSVGQHRANGMTGTLNVNIAE